MAPTARKSRDTVVGHPAVFADVPALFGSFVEHVSFRRASAASAVHKPLNGGVFHSAVFTVIVRHDVCLSFLRFLADLGCAKPPKGMILPKNRVCGVFGGVNSPKNRVLGVLRA